MSTIDSDRIKSKTGPRITVEIAGVAGASKRQGQGNKLTVREFSAGVYQEGRWVPGSAATMAVSSPGAKEYVFRRTPDKASADLKTYCCKGKVLDKVTVQVHTSAESKKAVIKYVLTRAIVTAVELDVGPDGASELVRISSAEVEWFYSDNSDPNVEAAGKYKWTDDDAGGE